MVNGNLSLPAWVVPLLLAMIALVLLALLYTGALDALLGRTLGLFT